MFLELCNVIQEHILHGGSVSDLFDIDAISGLYDTEYKDNTGCDHPALNCRFCGKLFTEGRV